MDPSQLLLLIDFAVKAHSSNGSKEATRRWDRKTPYSIHPIWCATMLLHESLLPERLRDEGSQALLLHDIKEDTEEELPSLISSRVAAFVDGMTFASFDEEVEKIWEREDEIKLLKLYDKASNLLDGIWMDDEKWNRYCDFVQLLIESVETEYGKLNITKIARAIAIRR